MKSDNNEDFDDDEPPMLEEETVDNQLSEESLQDSSIMDEMLAVAQRAKEDKRKQQDKERNRKSFGQGLKKGFFNTTKTTRDDRLLIVKQQEEETTRDDTPFIFPEVQEAMKSMGQLDPKGAIRFELVRESTMTDAEWMNDRFFEKLSRNPKLAQALQNPSFSKAINEMQQDPRAAILKYQKDPAVSTMLRDFMEFLGNHFEEMGASAEVASSQKAFEPQQNSSVSKGLQFDGNQTASTASKAPAIVDLDETRRQAIAGMQRTPAEEKQVQHILKNPELLAALSDGNLMQRLHACQKSPGEFQRLAQDPVLGPKLRLLVQNNMVQFA
ncbi:hypothetical protein P3T76_001974 [Phytophthora citrophthora]|uniref:STI1 domain-containing protein n=1 Tax=Phytophthora citrophthora TaxID=4793 RepID=A0AAD9GXJ2_9STRA|nr:hypothetical protein P3T76_001974 [Phytophthora citrophthora]